MTCCACTTNALYTQKERNTEVCAFSMGFLPQVTSAFPVISKSQALFFADSSPALLFSTSVYAYLRLFTSSTELATTLV